MTTLRERWTDYQRRRRTRRLDRANLPTAMVCALPAAQRAAVRYGVVVVPIVNPDQFTFIGSGRVSVTLATATNRPGALVAAAAAAR